MKKRWLILIVCLVLLGALVSRCTPDTSTDFFNSSYPTPTPEVTSFASPSATPFAITPTPYQNTAQVNTVGELIQYLNHQREIGILVTTVAYPHSLSQQDMELICDSTVSLYVQYQRIGGKYTFTLTQYPGDRIVKAHFSGDTSGLNSDELRVLALAEEMVLEAKSMTSDRIELELRLHDMLLQQCAYYGGSTEIADVNNPPRHLTVLGALLDGRANCQGYSDGFYTLASIAGFTVERMSVLSKGEEHMLNLIQLDGDWYVVDSTLHDNEPYNGRAEYLYPHFNAGLDMCGSLSWDPEEEHKPIAKVSHPSYYYYHIQNHLPRHNYNKIYTDLSSLAQGAVNEYLKKSATVVYMMLSNQIATEEEISQALYQAGTTVQKRFEYTYWHTVRGNHTYITVLFV